MIKTNTNEDKTLRKNPFTSYRDPVTGQWIIIKQEQQENSSQLFSFA